MCMHVHISWRLFCFALRNGGQEPPWKIFRQSGPWALGPLGSPEPMYRPWAHLLALGPFMGPGPIWARALPCGANTSPENAPKNI